MARISKKFLDVEIGEKLYFIYPKDQEIKGLTVMERDINIALKTVVFRFVRYIPKIAEEKIIAVEAETENSVYDFVKFRTTDSLAIGTSYYSKIPTAWCTDEKLLKLWMEKTK